MAKGICGCYRCVHRERVESADRKIAEFERVTREFMLLVHGEWTAADEANAELRAERETAHLPIGNILDRMEPYTLHSRDVREMVEWEYNELRGQQFGPDDPEFWEWDEEAPEGWDAA